MIKQIIIDLAKILLVNVITHINLTYMNCKKCKENYIINEDTYSCFNYIPIYYYLVINILKRY